MKPLICSSLVTGLAGSGNGQRIIDELHSTLLCLLHITAAQAVRKIQKTFQSAGAAYQQVTQMFSYGRNEILRVEALGKHLVQKQECAFVVTPEGCVNYFEIVLVVEHIEVADNIFIMDLGAAECHSLVEYGEGIAHRAVRLTGNHMERFVIYGDVLPVGNRAQVHHDVGHTDAVEIIGLTT